MGTRNLTMVVKNKKMKVAQYGQWDGYPSGQGTTILSFLKTRDLKKFSEYIDKTKFYTDSELDELVEKINKIPEYNLGGNRDWKKDYPHLSRDMAGEILEYIMETKGEISLQNEEEFAGDSLMNEWSYLIDLDENKLEVYRGFNKYKVPDTERFAKYNNKETGGQDFQKYLGIKLLKTYDINNLPTIDDFVSEYEII